MVPIFGNHGHAFHIIWPSYLLAYMQPYPSQKIATWFFENEGGGRRPFGIFSENSSNLVERPFPKREERNHLLQNIVFLYPRCNISDCFYCESCRGWQSWLTYTRCMRLLSYDFSGVTFSSWMVLRHISFVSSIGYCFLVLTFTWLGKLRNIATTKLVNSDK